MRRKISRKTRICGRRRRMGLRWYLALSGPRRRSGRSKCRSLDSWISWRAKLWGIRGLSMRIRRLNRRARAHHLMDNNNNIKKLRQLNLNQGSNRFRNENQRGWVASEEVGLRVKNHVEKISHKLKRFHQCKELQRRLLFREECQ